MNKILTSTIDEHSPQFTKHIAEGAVATVLSLAPEYLDEIINTSMKTMGHSGLEYHGWRKLTPKEEFNSLFTIADKKTNYDFAVSNLYLVEFRFIFNGTPIPKYVYLPYATKSNLMKISDTIYNIVPVLSDTVISPDHKEVFVRLLKDKLTFNRFSRNYIVNGSKIPGQIIHSNTYRLAGRKIVDNLGSVNPSTSLYLLGEYGFSKSLKKYANVDNYILTKDEDLAKYVTTYDIYESTRLKPRGLKDTYYKGHELKILIPKNEVTDENKPFLDNFIFGILYTFDVLPDTIDDYIDINYTHDITNEILFWRLALGRIIFRNGYSVDKIMTEMNDHFNTLQNYMDNIIIQKLKDVGYDVTTYFDLVAIILTNFNKWLLNSKEYNSDISNRYVDVLYYILFDIIYGINRSLFDINKKSHKKELTLREVQSIFKNYLSPKTIFKIVKASAINLTLNVTTYSGDVMYPKITSQFKDQSQGNGVKVGRKSQFPESTRTLRGYDLWLGTLLFLSKNAPSPRFRMNIYMDYNIFSGKLKIPKNMKSIIPKLDRMLLGKEQNNQKILDSENVVTLDSLE